MAALNGLAERLRAEGKPDEAGIFEAQALLAEDPGLSDEVARRVRDEGEQLDAAIGATVAEMRAALEALDDAYLRERAADMDAIGQSILAALHGNGSALRDLPPGAIVVAPDLTPAETADLRGGSVAGFATAYGGPTGHTAILARALGIPAAVGLGAAALEIADGAELILDGGAALLIADPSADETPPAEDALTGNAGESAGSSASVGRRPGIDQADAAGEPVPSPPPLSSAVTTPPDPSHDASSRHGDSPPPGARE